MCVVRRRLFAPVLAVVALFMANPGAFASETASEAPYALGEVIEASAPAETPSSRETAVELAWRAPSQDPADRVERTRAAALKLGLRNVEPAARALLAGGSSEISVARAEDAATLAPDLPSAHMARARAYWKDGDPTGALRATLEALAALDRDLESSLWLRASGAVLLCATLVFGAFVFIALAFVTVVRRAAHDVGDWISTEMPEFARAALLGVMLAAPILLGEGPIGLALVLFGLGCLFGDARRRVALGIAAVMLLGGTFYATRLVGASLGALGSDPLAHAVAAAEAGNASPIQIARLERAAPTSARAAAALALRAKRTGYMDEANARFSELLAEMPNDPVLANNAANVRVALGDPQSAIELYRTAARRLDSALVYYNLSQAYGLAIELEEQDRALSRAQSLDLAVVDELSDLHSLLGSTFVADLATPLPELREHLFAAAEKTSTGQTLLSRWAPGVLGREPVACVAAFGFLALVAAALGKRLARSTSCRRCGGRLCPRCDGARAPGSVCLACARLFHRPETTDPALRAARLAELERRNAWRGRLTLLTSLGVPGGAGLVASRPFLALFGVLLFCAIATCVVSRGGVVPDPLALGGAGRLATWLVTSILGVIYLAVLGFSIRTRGDA
jgi:tetratricopeptide (TPR) repeat protein